MQLIKFIKAQGLGNDFVIIPSIDESVVLNVKQIIHICDRHFGVGCDQLIIIEKSTEADCKMVIYNADGSGAEACGNATRCVALLEMHERNCTELTIEINDHIFSAFESDGKITVDMGSAKFISKNIPDNYFAPLPAASIIDVGNPHVIFFVENLLQYNLKEIGPQIEYDPLFPNQINITLAEIIDHDNIKVKVWERGAGETLACGTAACATAFAACNRGLVNDKINIIFDTGSITISIKNSNILMTGPANLVFTGEFII